MIATVDEVRLVYADQLIARHERCWEKEKFRYNPVHYLALLERKPGGFDYARPLRAVGTSRLSSLAPTSARGRRRAAGHTIVHPCLTALGEVHT